MEVLEGKVISSKRLEEIKNKAIDWALAHGISLRPSKKDEDQDKVTYVPFTLFPTRVPYHLLQHARLSMVHFNRLMHRVSMDHEFLQEAFKNVIQVDEFTRKLWNIYLAVKDDPKTQPIYLGSFRNDFMFQIEEENNQSLKQVEFNTISIASCGISSKLPGLYRYILNCADVPFEDEQIPVKDICQGQVAAFVKAWELYDNPKAIIVFLVLHNERYAMDQRLVEFEMYKQNPKIRVVRKTFDDLIRSGELTEDRKYMVDSEEVALVYYRAGYNPTEYTSEQIWKVRLEIEQGTCIKCPPIHYQLAGTKKIQQILSEPQVLNRFIDDINAIDMIQSTFAQQYTLDFVDEGERAIDMAIEFPEQFVLKPQREGGGNNMYGSNMKEFLKTIRKSQERCAYILMDLINPVKSWNYIIKPTGPLKAGECVTELGVYGCFIGKQNEELYNTETGFVMKSKYAECNEGGISAGFGGLDFPFLFDI